jgi:hypothetical protein
MAHYCEERKIIVDDWHVDDVLNQRPDLTMKTKLARCLL